MSEIKLVHNIYPFFSPCGFKISLSTISCRSLYAVLSAIPGNRVLQSLLVIFPCLYAKSKKTFCLSFKETDRFSSLI